MTNPQEPSYYEIALTNRQVVVAFTILLLCLVSAFFSGIWVGRGGAQRAVAESVVRTTPPPQRTEAVNLEELEFFDQPGAAPGAAGSQQAAGKPGNSPSTLQDDLARRDGTAAPVPAAAPEESPAAVEAPAAPVPAPPPAPAPVEPAATKPQPVKPVKAVAEPAAGSVVIQVFASPEKNEANRIKDRLLKGGQSAYLSPVTVGGRVLYRVRIGPFKSKADAQKTADQVRRGYQLDTWVTQ